MTSECWDWYFTNRHFLFKLILCKSEDIKNCFSMKHGRRSAFSNISTTNSIYKTACLSVLSYDWFKVFFALTEFNHIKSHFLFLYYNFHYNLNELMPKSSHVTITLLRVQLYIRTAFVISDFCIWTVESYKFTYGILHCWYQPADMFTNRNDLFSHFLMSDGEYICLQIFFFPQNCHIELVKYLFFLVCCSTSVIVSSLQQF